MFIFKKASHLDRKHYVAKHANVAKQAEVAVSPVKVAENTPVVEVVEAKKPRPTKKPATESV